jgi:hypothetical protein
MIHHLVLFKLKPGTDEEKIELMMRETRMRLLKIPEVLTVRCGKQLNPKQEWPFFFALDVESTEKLAQYLADPNYLRYEEEVIAPHVTERLTLEHEVEPGRDTRYS